MFRETHAVYRIVKLCFYKHSTCNNNILISKLALFHLKYMASTKQLLITDFLEKKSEFHTGINKNFQLFSIFVGLSKNLDFSFYF